MMRGGELIWISYEKFLPFPQFENHSSRRYKKHVWIQFLKNIVFSQISSQEEISHCKQDEIFCESFPINTEVGTCFRSEKNLLSALDNKELFTDECQIDFGE
ncbi:hypothetical protein TNCV_2578611 [Trichonephila clavipes]|nr:hypothetical protein TNCV_2578611 [Trichonephila clavipes]